MAYFLIDTNVALVANGNANHVDTKCTRSCLLRLIEIQATQKIVRDSCGLILKEYLKYEPYGSPRGPGAEFMVWAITNQKNRDVCLKAIVTPKDGAPLPRERNAPDPDLEEFPDDPALDNFDRQDRKFVAASIASNVDPLIVNATDTGWKNHTQQLARHGVRLEHLCI